MVGKHKGIGVFWAHLWVLIRTTLPFNSKGERPIGYVPQSRGLHHEYHLEKMIDLMQMYIGQGVRVAMVEPPPPLPPPPRGLFLGET